ncbi:hypothetical protein H744_1c1697 [Photobacterium gaetbulicola Gung47]|uniref:Uncharacterized protein n=1 Tax=Photobacterium gaetbulicola Gung47 TaxID=658445 RepID=A0A0C5WUJ9_9GAMM|nr:hypothetical protein H744_1c1697 [Photobacterium gaetbulicola Gung47]
MAIYRVHPHQLKGKLMLTGYWSIDAFIIAMATLCALVATIFGYLEWTGGGHLTPPNCKHDTKE